MLKFYETWAFAFLPLEVMKKKIGLKGKKNSQ